MQNIIWFVLRDPNKKYGMSHAAAKFVPQLITEDQKHQVEVCEDPVEIVNNNDTFLKNIIIGDKKLAYGYDVETKVQPSHWTMKCSQDPKHVS